MPWKRSLINCNPLIYRYAVEAIKAVVSWLINNCNFLVFCFLFPKAAILNHPWLVVSNLLSMIEIDSTCWLIRTLKFDMAGLQVLSLLQPTAVFFLLFFLWSFQSPAWQATDPGKENTKQSTASTAESTASSAWRSRAFLQCHSVKRIKPWFDSQKLNTASARSRKCSNQLNNRLKLRSVRSERAHWKQVPFKHLFDNLNSVVFQL